MTDEEIESQRSRVKRADFLTRKLKNLRAYRDGLLKSGDDTTTVVSFHELSYEGCCLPTSLVRDDLVKRIAEYEQTLSKELESL